MTTPHDSPIPADPHDAAAHWFARCSGGLMDAAERARFDAWRNADPAHQRAWDDMQRIWSIAQSVPDAHFHAIVQAPAPAPAQADTSSPPNQTTDRWQLPPPRGYAPDGGTNTGTTPSSAAHRPARRRRRLSAGLAATCATAAALYIALPAHWYAAPDFTHQYATAIGERREVALPDGSTLTLNTASTARVQYHSSQRHIVLERGEALFDVQPDPAQHRPFIVEAGAASVRVTGTRFNVRLEPAHTSVAVQQGAVEVAQGPWWQRQRLQLTAGQAATLGSTGQLLPKANQHADIAALTAWQQGKLVFDNAPLADIIAELNRYRTHPITLRDASLGRHRISGVFSADQPDAFLKSLPRLAPARVQRRPDGGSDIVRR